MKHLADLGQRKPGGASKGDNSQLIQYLRAEYAPLRPPTHRLNQAFFLIIAKR
jgi:hypothetical protein